MSRRSRRAQARSVVLTEGLPFSDSFDPGADSLPSATPQVPRVLSPIQKLLRDELYSSRPVPKARAVLDYSWGRGPAVLEERRRARRALPRSIPPPHAKRLDRRLFIKGWWNKLNRLQAKPYQLFCVKRKVRRSVLFAKRVAGYKRRSPGSGGGYRRSITSQWRC